MLFHSTPTSSTPTPGSQPSPTNTLEPSTTMSTNSSSSQLQQQQQQQHNTSLSASASSSSTQSYSQQYLQQQQQMSSLNSRPPSRAPSILDSPTLARVERARLRLEASEQQNLHDSCGSNINVINPDGSLERSILDPKKDAHPWHQIWTHMKRLSHNSKVNSPSPVGGQKKDNTTAGISILFPNRKDALEDSLNAKQVFKRPDMQSLLAGRIPVGSMTGPIKRGLLWQQRDRLFSRWKERYFVLTRDYLHCFKRASGSANERASDMGQFIFKVKLVDVEKVEWLNRRSYSAIGLLLGREGRVLLRCDEGLEDWFELLEECTETSKERRRALKIAQGPRSRASLAAPVTHAALQSNHFGLGGNYSSALDDWLMTNGSGMGGARNQKLVTNSMCGYGSTNPFLFSDSVPDLSALNNENHQHTSGMSTNHSTPQKIPYSAVAAGNNSRYSNGYSSQNSSFSNSNTNSNVLYGSPRRFCINSSFGSTHIVDEEAEDGEVELRRPRVFRHLSTQENGNELDRDWLYRKPNGPNDMRHSVQPMLPTSNNTSNSKLTTDLDYSAHDSGLDTPPSTTNRPSSYRDAVHQSNGVSRHQPSPRDSTETSESSSRGTMLNSPGGSFRAKHLQQVANLNQVNALHGSRYSVQERILKIRNDEDRKAYHSDVYDPNQNRYCKNGNQSPVSSLTPQHTPVKQQHSQLNGNANHNAALNGNMPLNGSALFRERYQHPALAAIINEAQGLKFRDRSYSDCQQMPPRRKSNNNLSPLTARRNHVNPIFGTPTRSDKMRSRTEMVTTTFVDSEEDYSDDDDSEEDWRPSASSKNGKKQKHHKSSSSSSKKGGRKRKGSSSGANAKHSSKRKPTDANEGSDGDEDVDDDNDNDNEDEVSEDDYEYDDYESASGSTAKKTATSLPPKKQFTEKNNSSSGNGSSEDETLKLLVYVKDLAGDYRKNNRLCLWRKDNNNLLQKYIKVKTTPEEFLFTSSSVYSSFDDKRISDFYDIKVKCLDSSNRRVRITNPSDLHKIAAKASKPKDDEDSDAFEDDQSDDISESELEKKEKSSENKENYKKNNMKMKLLQKHKHNANDDDDDEEEVEEENDEEEDDGDLEGDDDDDEVENDDDEDDDE